MFSLVRVSVWQGKPVAGKLYVNIHCCLDAFLDNLKKRKDSLGQKLNELELEIGNIAIDDLSIDAAE